MGLFVCCFVFHSCLLFEVQEQTLLQVIVSISKAIKHLNKVMKLIHHEAKTGGKVEAEVGAWRGRSSQISAKNQNPYSVFACLCVRVCVCVCVCAGFFHCLWSRSITQSHYKPLP